MEFEAFVDTIRELCKRCREENVSITWTIYPDYAEISIEPFQPINKVVNEGSKLYYEFKEGGPDE